MQTPLGGGPSRLRGFSPLRSRAESVRTRARPGVMDPYGAERYLGGAMPAPAVAPGFGTGSPGVFFAAPHPEAGPLPHRPAWIAPAGGRRSVGGGTAPVPPAAERSVGDYIAITRRARHDMYIRQAWESFRAGEYLRALSRFRLAGTVAVEGTEARRGALYAALASGQYTLAAAMLGTLLRDDPDLLAHRDRIRSRYPSPDDYREQRRRLAEAAERADAPVVARALYAFFIWQDADSGSPDELHAIGLARIIAEEEPTGRYAVLVERMQPGVSSRPAGR